MKKIWRRYISERREKWQLKGASRGSRCRRAQTRAERARENPSQESPSVVNKREKKERKEALIRFLHVCCPPRARGATQPVAGLPSACTDFGKSTPGPTLQRFTGKHVWTMSRWRGRRDDLEGRFGHDLDFRSLDLAAYRSRDLLPWPWIIFVA